MSGVRVVVVGAAVAALACARTAPSLPAPAFTASPPPSSELGARLDGVVRSTLATGEQKLAGLAVQVRWRGEVVLDAGYGLADLEARAPMRPDHIFRIGSISKPFAAAVLLRLAARGLVSLDDPVDRHVAGYPMRGQVITLRHLLSHTSGIANYTALPGFLEHTGQPVPRDQMVAMFSAPPLGFAPGTRFSYSNSNYYLLGLVIEKVTGRPYADVLHDEVLAPLALADTRTCPDAQDYPRAARGYRVDRDRLAPALPIAMQNPYAAGALCSTTRDLVAFAGALAGGRVVDARAWATMTTPPTLAGGRPSSYGHGLSVSALDGHRRVGHNGGISGFSSYLAIYPDDDLYVVVLANTETPLTGILGARLARAALGIPEPIVKDLPISAEEAAPLLGVYELRELDQRLQLVFRDGALRVATPEGVKSGRPLGPRLRSQGGGVYVVPELRATVRFRREGDWVTGVLVEQDGQEHEGERAP
jgi:CubicO group peptidase (beta-lactamase class C family)